MCTFANKENCKCVLELRCLTTPQMASLSEVIRGHRVAHPVLGYTRAHQHTYHVTTRGVQLTGCFESPNKHQQHHAHLCQEPTSRGGYSTGVAGNQKAMNVGHDLGVREIHLHQVLITMPSVQILDVLEQVVTITLADPFQPQGTRTKPHEDERSSKTFSWAKQGLHNLLGMSAQSAQSAHEDEAAFTTINRRQRVCSSPGTQRKHIGRGLGPPTAIIILSLAVRRGSLSQGCSSSDRASF